MTDETPEITASAPKSESSPIRDFVTHQRKAVEEAGKAFEALIPPDFRIHSRAAREEWLLSFKVLIEGAASMVDHEINRMQSSKSSSSSSGPSTTGKSKVKVEVS